MSTTTVPLEQHPTAADRETTLRLINRCMPVFADEVHHASNARLTHEAERLESQRPSPVRDAMRLIVDIERAARQTEGPVRHV
jgi:hypothetical protein